MRIVLKGWTPPHLRKYVVSGLFLGTGLFSYFNFISNKFEIICGHSQHNTDTINNIRELRLPFYRTSFVLPLRFMEIIYGALFDNNHFFRYDREIVHAVDGEQIVLDWGALHAKFDDSEEDLQRVPVVVLLPGISGRSSTPYMKATMNEICSGGFRPVVFNPRGAIVSQISDNVFDFRDNEKDLETALAHIKKKYPRSNIYFMGISFGASYGLRVLSRNQDSVKGMVSVSNPFDMYKAGQNLNSKRNFIYA